MGILLTAVFIWHSHSLRNQNIIFTNLCFTRPTALFQYSPQLQKRLLETSKHSSDCQRCSSTQNNVCLQHLCKAKEGKRDFPVHQFTWSLLKLIYRGYKTFPCEEKDAKCTELKVIYTVKSTVEVEEFCKLEWQIVSIKLKKIPEKIKHLTSFLSKFAIFFVTQRFSNYMSKVDIFKNPVKLHFSPLFLVNLQSVI